MHWCSNKNILSDPTRNKYVIVLPNLTNDLNNYDIELLLSNGCQAMCMKFQNMDNNLLAYHELFKIPSDWQICPEAMNYFQQLYVIQLLKKYLRRIQW